MSRPVQNFRGRHALVLHPTDQNRLVLENTLVRLGLGVTSIDPPPGGSMPAMQERVDLAFLDVDSGGSCAPAWSQGDIPLIAIIGHESPSRLQQAFELLPSAFLLKPVRPSGVYTAIFFAINGHARDRQQAKAVASLEARHRARRLVMKAVLRVMECHGVDDDEAYRRMRKESMRLRITVEDLSSRILGTNGATAPAPERLAGSG
ncbi:MAG: ANTAR domain-containing response regulator [Geminicoccaceae bacterium]